MFEIKLNDSNNINETINNLCLLVDEIPFGNSDYQNITTIVDGEITPERAYRHSALRIMNRLNALNECYYTLKENDIKIKRLDREIEKLQKTKTENYDLDIEEKQVQKEKIISGYAYTQKLIKDAIGEINILSPVITKLGKITREQFEANEKNHFELKEKGLKCDGLYLDIKNNLLINK